MVGIILGIMDELVLVVSNKVMVGKKTFNYAFLDGGYFRFMG